MTAEQKQFFTSRISQANRTELVVIIYEMTDHYIMDAMQDMEQKDWENLELSLGKVRGCMNELLNSLHPEYPIAGNLRQLYMYCLRRLVHATKEKDVEILKEVKSILNRLYTAYKEAVKGDASEPEMMNTQTVYSGLTYGKTGAADTTCFFKASK